MQIFLGLLMGVVYAAAPGPVNIETIRRGVKGGFMDSLAVQIGSSVGRIVYALLALLGAGLLLQGESLQLAIGVFGTTVLFYLGVNAIRDWRGLVNQAGEVGAQTAPSRHAFWTGATLSLANPLAIVFWLSIGSRVAQEPGLESTTFLLGFFAGCAVVSLFVSVFASFWQTRLTTKVALSVSWVCGLVLIGFGLRLGYAVGLTFNFW
ncbi:LysE family translocator [Candidatus Leptofilum sp.]|uniref:LysE family translocator n=1 Tax=Candidatus Leptofilum sp. TaxID=3241576 RepID=UPI003B5B549D